MALRARHSEAPLLSLPFLLFGTLAAVVPVILHLTGRSKPILHRFPAMRFILQSQRSSSRALRLKHWLVLLLRIAALVLIGLALDRPRMGASAVAAGATFFGVILVIIGLFALYRREFIAGTLTLLSVLALYASMPDLSPHLRNSLHGDIVLVLDQSMSMSYQESESSRFDLARRQAMELLDRLSPDSRVALLLAGRTVERVQGRLTYRLDAVRQKLKEATVIASGLDIARALQTAEEIIVRDEASRPAGTPASIVFFTDMQRNGFEALAGSRVTVTDAQKREKTPVVFVDVGSDQARNGGMLEASLPGVILPVDSASTLTAKIRLPDKNHASLVELFLDGKRVDQKLVDAKGQDTAGVEFRFLTGAAGPHAITLHLADPDRLPLDQDYHLTYSSGRPDRALIVESPATEKHGSGFFLRAALQPAPAGAAADGLTNAGDESPLGPLGMSGLTCVVEPPTEFTALKLSAYKVVILADCGTLSESSWAALQQWTNDGGGLFVWLGPKTDLSVVRKYGLQVFAAHRGLLPGTIGELVTFEKPIRINEVQTEHPLLAHFTLDVSRELRSTSINKIVKVTPDTGEGGASVVLSANDYPVLIEKSYGRGRVLMSTIDPGLDYSDIVRRGGSFVTLMLNSVHLLAENDNDVNPHLGQPLALSLSNGPKDGRVMWRDPSGKGPVELKVEDLNSDDRVKAASGHRAPVTLAVPRLESTGIHRFAWLPPDAKIALQKLVAVNHDSSEIDLAKFPVADAEKLLADVKPQVVKNFADGDLFKNQISMTVDERKYELAAMLIVMLLALLLGESFLSNRFYRGEDEVADGRS